MLRQDSQLPALRANGGTALGFASYIAYRQHHIPTQNVPEYLITTLYFNQNYVTLATIYVRPGHPLPNDFFTYISNNFRTYIIIAGINIHSRTDREKTNCLNFIEFQTTGIIHKLPQTTRPISNTTPDVVITSTNLTHRCTTEVLDLLGSDHAPIKLTLHCQLRPLPNPNTTPRQTLRYDKANWTGYRDYIETHINPEASPATEDELYSILDNINTTFQQATEKFIPKSSMHPYRPNLPPQYFTANTTIQTAISRLP